CRRRGRRMKTPNSPWSMRAEDQSRLDAELAAFLSESGSRCAVLIGHDGQLLTSAGDLRDLDGVSFASLAAADFAAGAQPPRVLGHPAGATLYPHGDPQSLYLVGLGNHAILAALFENTTTLGMVRLATRAAVPRLTAIFEAMAAAPAQPSA